VVGEDLRAEDKEVDGLELERQTERQRESELEQEDEEELPELQSSEDRDAEHRGAVIAAMRMIFEHEHIVVDELGLPARELKALEALKAAVDGKDGALSQFVYATDRKAMLEQALAVLQPNFVSGDAQHAQVLGSHRDLIDKVADLRHGLVELADAQDELLHANANVAVTKDDGDKDDDEEDDDKPKKSTLSDGPVVTVAPKPASTLGDAADLAAAEKTPWWKRALGRE
jgi:hypothetical protein